MSGRKEMSTMRPSASQAVEALDFEILYDDGEPLDTTWHGFQIALLVELAHRAMAERGTNDFHAAGNQFVYWSVEQARAVARDLAHTRTRHLRGPDFVFVGGVEPRERPCWVVWQEGGRAPDVILELLSPSTAVLDRTRKKDEYERSLRAPELFHYDPETGSLVGWRLVEGKYREMRPNPEGRFYSHGLGLWIGTWQGVYLDYSATWVRLFDDQGRRIPTGDEGIQAGRAETLRERAARDRERAAKLSERTAKERERARADAAEAELSRLRAALGERATS